MVWDEIALTVCPPGMDGGGIADPHFKTWHGEWYDFHGICDLVLVHNEKFSNGLGMDIHLRTKDRYEYSYIQTAAIKIGDDVLEVGSWGEYWFNGVEGAELSSMGSQFPVTYTSENKKRHQFVVKTGDATNEESIVVRTFKDMVSVTVENATVANFGMSVGLMGNFIDGSLVGRDGTVMDDHDMLGQDWQILESEPMLFQAPSNKPYGTCTPPTATGRRRLGESIAMEAAEKACSKYDDEKKRDMCIFDVMAMGDLEVAEVHGAF